MLRHLCLTVIVTVVAAIDIDSNRHQTQAPAAPAKDAQPEVVAVRIHEDGKVSQNEDAEASQKSTLMRSQDRYTQAASLVGEQENQVQAQQISNSQLPGPQTQYGYGSQAYGVPVPPLGYGPLPALQAGQNVMKQFTPVGPPLPGEKAGGYGEAYGPAYVPSEVEELMPAGFYLNMRPCRVPQWESGEVLCKEASKKARSQFAYVALDQLGQKQSMMRDGGVCTTQCSRDMWWQRPVTANITCQKGYWVDHYGRDIDEMKCRTAPHIWALLTAIIGVVFVFVWVFVYYQPTKGSPAPEQNASTVLAPTLPPRVANSVYVIRD